MQLKFDGSIVVQSTIRSQISVFARMCLYINGESEDNGKHGWIVMHMTKIMIKWEEPIPKYKHVLHSLMKQILLIGFTCIYS